MVTELTEYFTAPPRIIFTSRHCIPAFILALTHTVDGSHGDGGDPGSACCRGFVVAVYLDVEDPEGLDDPEGQAEDQEARQQDDPAVAAIWGHCHSWR